LSLPPRTKTTPSTKVSTNHIHLPIYVDITVENQVRRISRLLLWVLVAAFAVVAIPAGAASAASAADDPSASVLPKLPKLPKLPITQLTQILADGLHSHLFLSSSGSVVVTDLTGKLVTRLYSRDEASYLAMSGDGDTLYAALTGANEVAAVSTVTLRQTAIYHLQPAESPAGVAVQDGKLWVSYTTTDGKPAGIGDFALGTARPAFTADALPGPAWTTAPRLAADPKGEGVLAAIGNTAQAAMIATYGVSGARPALLAQAVAQTACKDLSDAAVTPAGAQLILACDGAANDAIYKTATLALAGDYRTGALPEAIAVAGDGSVATGAGAAAGRQLRVFQAGRKAAVSTYEFAKEAQVVATAGLAWTADSTRLFAVLRQRNTSGYYLDELLYPQYKTSSINLISTGPFHAGGKVVLHGKLTLGAAEAPAGVSLTIERTLAAHPSSVQVTFTVKTRAGGVFTLTDWPPAYGGYAYTDHYASNGTYEPAYHETLVIISPLHTRLTVTPSATAVKKGTSVQVNVHLGRTYRNRVVSIYAHPAGGARKLLRTGEVGARGNLAVSYRITRDTTFTAVFAGDPHYAPARAMVTVTVEA
jgi:hypothetical protein